MPNETPNDNAPEGGCAVVVDAFTARQESRPTTPDPDTSPLGAESPLGELSGLQARAAIVKKFVARKIETCHLTLEQRDQLYQDMIDPTPLTSLINKETARKLRFPPVSPLFSSLRLQQALYQQALEHERQQMPTPAQASDLDGMDVVQANERDASQAPQPSDGIAPGLSTGLAATDRTEDDPSAINAAGLRADQIAFSDAVIEEGRLQWARTFREAGMTRKEASKLAKKSMDQFMEQAPAFPVFVARLTETADALDDPLELLGRISQIIVEIREAGPRRTSVIEQINEALGECGDRISIGLDNAEIAIEESKQESQNLAGLEKVEDMACRMYHLDALDHRAREFANRVATERGQLRETGGNREESEYVLDFRTQARSIDPQFIPGSAMTMLCDYVQQEVVKHAMTEIGKGTDAERNFVNAYPRLREWVDATDIPERYKERLGELRSELNGIAARDLPTALADQCTFAEEMIRDRERCEEAIGQVYAEIVGEYRASRHVPCKQSPAITAPAMSAEHRTNRGRPDYLAIHGIGGPELKQHHDGPQSSRLRSPSSPQGQER